jgi:hypothetical protein
MKKFADLKNTKLIPFNDKYELCFVDEVSYAQPSPVSDYYFKVNDLSINLLISLK